MSLRQVLTLNASFSIERDNPMTYKILKIMGIYEGLNIIPTKLGLPFLEAHCEFGLEHTIAIGLVIML
jgi:hypothetical protein